MHPVEPTRAAFYSLNDVLLVGIPVLCCSRLVYVQPLKLARRRRFAFATQTATSFSSPVTDQVLDNRAACSARTVSTDESPCRLAFAAGRRAPLIARQGVYMTVRGVVLMLCFLGSVVI